MTILSSTPFPRADAPDAARKPLLRHAPSASPAVKAEGAALFQASLAASAGRGATEGEPAASAESISAVYRGSRSGELSTVQKFEGFVLRSFVESMLPSDNSSFFGTGTAGKIWKSMLAERIGDEMAGAGGIGIADMIAKHGPKAAAVEGAVNDMAKEEKLAASAAAAAEPADTL